MAGCSGFLEYGDYDTLMAIMVYGRLYFDVFENPRGASRHLIPIALQIWSVVNIFKF